MRNSRGVIYIATGRSFIEEAKRSAKSVRSNTDLPIVLYTNKKINADVFDEIYQITNSQHTVADSIIREDMFPFERNLFLDTDTYICDSLTELFKLLDDYDIAMCQSPGRKTVGDLPTAFREFNTGVIAYRNNTEVQNLFTDWMDSYKKQTQKTGHVTNQGTFSKTIYKSDIDFITLPQEYNIRTRRGYANGQIKIVHGRHPAGLPAVAEAINKSKKPRVFQMSNSFFGDPVHVKTEERLLYRFEKHPFQIKNRIKRLQNKTCSGNVSTIIGSLRRFIRRRFTNEDP